MCSAEQSRSIRTVFQDAADTPVAALWQRWQEDRCPDFGASDGLNTDLALPVLRFDQLQRWRGGDRVPAERYLETCRVLTTDPERGLVLVYGEYLLREELGEAPTLDEYIRRFPQYSDRLRQQDEFHRALAGPSSPTALASPGTGRRATPPDLAGHCRIVGAIASGGMGEVFLGRDDRLGRDLAVKILRDEYANQPGVMRRFLAEARISGQLQHPGIVPVHDVGHLADGRPFFTMKLIRGQTLAALIAERSTPATDLPRYLGIFEQVCQAVAYAHSQGIVHRDLKPANIMVGAFGEVQVMDWGLAKARHDVGLALSCLPATTNDPTTKSPSDATKPGSVVGTPAYMPPEQARGEADRLDERSDVFGLGAILCEILTGQPPYSDNARDDVLTRARQGDLDSARARINACGAEKALRDLAVACLATDPIDRPRDAGAVATAVTTHLASVQERLRAAEVEQAAALARATAERRARRLTVGLAAAVLGVGLVGGVSWLALERNKAEAARGVEGALQTAAQLQGQERWPEALAVVERADAQMTDSTPAELRQRVADRLIDLKAVAQLDDVRLLMFDHREAAAQACAATLRRCGIDVEALEPAVAAERIRERAIRDQLVAAVDDWSLLPGDTNLRERLAAIARTADPDDWRNAVRAAAIQKDVPALTKLAESHEIGDQPVRALVLLANALERASPGSSNAGALRVARLAQQRAPGDLYANHQLAGALDDQAPPRLDEALRYFTTAVALRPRSAAARMNLGYALERKGNLNDAVVAYEESLHLKPDFALAYLNLGNALQRQGKLDKAIESFHESIRLDPSDSLAHYDLGNALVRSDRPDEAIPAYRAALRIKPDFAKAQSNLGIALVDAGELGEAITAYQEALHITPTDVFALNNLGRAFQQAGRFDEAVTMFREALRVEPDYAMAQCNLGLALQRQGHFPEALDALRRGHDMGKKDPRWSRPSASWIRQCERMIALDRRLPAILAGTDVPAVHEREEVAELCLIRRYPAVAAQLLAKSLAERPPISSEWKAGRRYNAACAAALAGCGKGQDAPPLDDQTRTQWRKQALNWLRADLGMWSEQLASNSAATRRTLRLTLRHWQQDPDLAGLRDPSALASLPTSDQKACEAVWSDVTAVLARTIQPQ
jgi:serine/threonine-protein kinase